MGNRMERQEKKNSGDGKPAKAKFDWKLLPDVLALIKPRRLLQCCIVHSPFIEPGKGPLPTVDTLQLTDARYVLG